MSNLEKGNEIEGGRASEIEELWINRLEPRDLLPFILSSLLLWYEALIAAAYRLPPEVYSNRFFNFGLRFLSEFSKLRMPNFPTSQWRLAVYGTLSVFAWGAFRTAVNIGRRSLEGPDSPIARLDRVDENFPFLSRLFEGSQPGSPTTADTSTGVATQFNPSRIF